MLLVDLGLQIAPPLVRKMYVYIHIYILYIIHTIYIYYIIIIVFIYRQFPAPSLSIHIHYIVCPCQFLSARQIGSLFDDNLQWPRDGRERMGGKP